MHINILTRETKWHYTTTPVVVHSDNPFHLVNNPIEYVTLIVQFAQHRTTHSGNFNPQNLSPNSSGKLEHYFKPVMERMLHEKISS
jgi:hypothetical protein